MHVDDASTHQGVSGDDAHGRRHPGAAQAVGDVAPVEPENTVHDGEVGAAKSIEHSPLIRRVGADLQGDMGCSPVIGTGIEVGNAESRGESARHRALADTARTIDGYDHSPSNTSPNPGHDTSAASKPATVTGAPRTSAATAAAIAIR